MATPRHIKKTVIWFGVVGAVALLAFGYGFYPKKFYTLEQNYHAGVLCKDITEDDCIIFENATKNISNIDIVSRTLSAKNIKDIDFWFVFYKSHSNAYSGLISLSPNINQLNSPFSVASYSFMDIDPYVDMHIAESIVSSLIREISKGE